MTLNGEQHDTLREYLLGKLSEDAREQLEWRLMTQDEAFQELLIEEDELVDDYACDVLSEDERSRCDNHFLCTPERQRKLRFAVALKGYLQAPSGRSWSRGRRPFRHWIPRTLPHPTPVWGAVAATLVLSVSAGVWSTVGFFRIRDQLEQVLAERGALLREREDLKLKIAAESARANERTPRRVDRQAPSNALRVADLEAPSFLLSSGLLRAERAMATIRIPPESKLVALQLDLGLDEYPEYRAALHLAGGDEVWTQAKLKARSARAGAMVVLTLPSQLLTPGDYYVKLEGVTDAEHPEILGWYDFRSRVE